MMMRIKSNGFSHFLEKRFMEERDKQHAMQMKMKCCQASGHSEKTMTIM